MNRRAFLLPALLVLSGFFSAKANIRLPRLISNGMVIQRDIEVPIWGWADPGEKVVINFEHNKYETTTGSDGKWRLKLKPVKAGGPYTMTLTGKNQLTVSDILAGDVWICSGQSNMALPMSTIRERYADIISHSANPQIRQFLLGRKYSLVEQLDDAVSDDGWQSANPQSLLEFTAVGYFFARDLYEKYKVPIGLINNSWGGTPAEAWISEEALKLFPHYSEEAQSFKDPARVAAIGDSDRAVLNDWYRNLQMNDSGFFQKNRNWADPELDETGWKPVQMPDFWDAQGFQYVHGVVWLRKKFTVTHAVAGKPAVLYLGNIADQDSTYIDGVKIGFTDAKNTARKYSIPSQLLGAGEHVLTVRVLNNAGMGGFLKNRPYKIVAGDQTISLAGEWKAHTGIRSRVAPRGTLFQYKPGTLFKGMLSPLLGYGIKGVIWYQGEANAERAGEYQTLFSRLITDWRQHWKQGNFPFLYVQLANYKKIVDSPGESSWASLREAQSMALELPNTGMAVIHDLGVANNIHPENKLDVGKRLALAAMKVAYKEKALVYSGPVMESVKKEGNKLVIRFAHTGSGLIAKGNPDLQYFAIAGRNNKFVWAKARIRNNTVIVWNDAVADPVSVRYAWADNPDGANLYNKEGLPASSFRYTIDTTP